MTLDLNTNRATVLTLRGKGNEVNSHDPASTNELGNKSLPLSPAEAVGRANPNRGVSHDPDPK
jgi:hypothetical protein